MRKRSASILLSLLLNCIIFTFPNQVMALGDLQCGKFTITTTAPDYYLASNPNKSFQVTVSYTGSGGALVGSVDNQNWGIELFHAGGPELLVAPNPSVGPRTVVFNVSEGLNPDFFRPLNTPLTLRFFVKSVHGHCPIKVFRVLTNPPVECSDFRVYQERTIGTGANATQAWCYAAPNGCIDENVNVMAEVKVTRGGVIPVGEKFIIAEGSLVAEECTVEPSGLCKPSQGIGRLRAGSRYLKLITSGAVGSTVCQTIPFLVGDCGTDPKNCNITPTDLLSGSTSTSATNEPYEICSQIDRNQDYLAQAYDDCMTCVGTDETDPGGIWTAIGCIPRDPTLIVQNLLRVGLGMGGGVALLMCLAAGFLFSTSQGDPKRTGEAKELVTAAITGLLFIIFSVVLLQFIGFTVLKIPGFGG